VLILQSDRIKVLSVPVLNPNGEWQLNCLMQQMSDPCNRYWLTPVND
jgi:hypothetical protein